MLPHAHIQIFNKSILIGFFVTSVKPNIVFTKNNGCTRIVIESRSMVTISLSDELGGKRRYFKKE